MSADYEETEIDGLREQIRILRAEARQQREYIRSLEPSRSPQRRNEELSKYSRILHAIQQQWTSHHDRDEQLRVVMLMLNGDLDNAAIQEIHITLKTVQKLLRTVRQEAMIHSTVKLVLRMAIDVLDAEQEAIPVKITRTETETGVVYETQDHNPPPKDMDDIPF